MNGVRVSREVQDRLVEEARWLTAPADANRWRVGTWVDTIVHHAPGRCGISSIGSVGVPAWFLPWNRPARRKNGS
jgi:hypothetical protein